MILRALSLNELLNEFKNLIDFEIKENEWNLIKNNVEKFSDIFEFLEIIRRNRIEISPSDDFVTLLLENINKFDGLEFEEYTKLLGQLDSNLSKKDIFHRCTGRCAAPARRRHPAQPPDRRAAH